MLRSLCPLVVSALGTATVLLVRPRRATAATRVAGAAVRGAVGVAAASPCLVGYWVRCRDRMRRKIRKFMDEGRADATAAQQRSTSA